MSWQAKLTLALTFANLLAMAWNVATPDVLFLGQLVVRCDRIHGKSFTFNYVIGHVSFSLSGLRMRQPLRRLERVAVRRQ